MAAAAPRKAPTKKTPPRKRPTKTTPVVPSAREQKVAAFEGLRQRAAGMGEIQRRVPAPVQLEGFDPPIIARWPEKMVDQVLLDAAADSGKPDLILLHLLGRDQLLRVAAEFRGLDDSDALLTGLVMWLWEQFLGLGAGDVPGGTPASSLPSA